MAIPFELIGKIFLTLIALVITFFIGVILLVVPAMRGSAVASTFY